MSSLRLFRRLVVLLGLAPAALAGTLAAPSGFNVETHLDAGSLLLPLSDGSQLLALGGFGAQDIARKLPDGTLIPFAAGFGSLASAAVSPVTGDLVVGDSFSAPALRLLRDLNADLDCLDAGEDVAHPVALPVLNNGESPLPFDLTFRPGTDELFVSGATSFAVSPVLGVVVRIAAGAAGLYAEDLGFAAGLQWSGDTLFVGDVDSSSFVGRVVRLRDLDHDGSALDAGEANDFAAGLSGAYDLVQAQDGSLYLSGLIDAGTSTGAVGRLLPDGDDDGQSDEVDEAFFTGFNFPTGLTLTEGPGGFVPGVDGDGLLVVGDSGVDGNRLVRTAPFAGLELSGTVANNSAFTLTVTGEAGAGGLLVLSLDQADLTLPGIGDLGLGFGAPHVILGLAPLDGTGQSGATIVLHGVDALVGTAFTAQGFTLQGGEVGIGDALDLVIAP